MRKIHNRHVGIGHRYRDTFALDLLSRGSWAYDVAKLRTIPWTRWKSTTRRLSESCANARGGSWKHAVTYVSIVTAGRFYCTFFTQCCCWPFHYTPQSPDPSNTSSAVACSSQEFLCSLLAAPKTADAITTRQLLDRGGSENNPTFRRYPSPAKQAGIKAGIFAAQSFAFYLTEHNRTHGLGGLAAR